MARPRAPHGTYAAYKRHLSEKTEVCAPCAAAQRQRTSEIAEARKSDRPKPVTLTIVDAPPTQAATDAAKKAAESGPSRLEVLREAQDLAKAALSFVAGDDPAKIAPLLRETREIAREIAEIESTEASQSVSLADQLAAARAARKANA
jgi:hypothetical protein